ncbi:hypothetical protein [Marinoscillum furvescens]|uniref:Uncharacterized protein n=1 Tax=Marinoscillum furvescens DSM 4134 TaxID=1122208 RepID=A0A3D9L4Z0_MARFU|nr:hypothetical protein [Marinoscillum furvescens]REE01052.1 hypothetical protein C7460_10471 [Marinoscillum furvescens DSM 4134]
MKLDPGYYKVKRKSRFVGGVTCHYLRVYVEGKKKYIQFDHGLPQEAEDQEDEIIHGYMIVKKITRPVEVKKIQVSVEWQDEDGDSFVMRAKNSYVLKRIFEYFPRVLKAFKV